MTDYIVSDRDCLIKMIKELEKQLKEQKDKIEKIKKFYVIMTKKFNSSFVYSSCLNLIKLFGGYP